VSERPWGSRDGGSSTALPRGVTLPREETLVGRMGIDVTHASPEQTVATMPVEPNRQPYGLLHGGASAVLAETVGSIAAAYHAHTIGKLAVGVELNCTHHRAVRSGTVTGTATKLHAGTSAATYEIVIVDEQDRRVCTSRLTCMLIDRAPGAPGAPGAPAQDPEGVVDSDDGDDVQDVGGDTPGA
jgi:1,4-dihydroxy-2-naphthoyl-CoA hydrolase